MASDERGSINAEHLLVCALVAIAGAGAWLGLSEVARIEAGCSALRIAEGDVGGCEAGASDEEHGDVEVGARDDASANVFSLAAEDDSSFADDAEAVAAVVVAVEPPPPQEPPQPAAPAPPPPAPAPPPPPPPPPQCDLLDVVCQAAAAVSTVADIAGDVTGDALDAAGDVVGDVIDGTANVADDVGSFVYGFASGFVDGAVGMVSGTIELGATVVRGGIDAVTHPAETLLTIAAGAQSVAWSATHLDQAIPGALDTAGTLVDAVGEGLRQVGDTLVNGTWEERGRIFGRVTFEVGSMVVPVTRLGAIGQLAGRAARVLHVPVPVLGRLAGRGARELAEAPRLIRSTPTTWTKLHDPNFFLEASGDLSNTRRVTGTLELLRSQELIVNGQAARLHGARFVNRSFRTDGDFRYAYGEEAFRAWQRADNRLNEIPVGQLGDRLSVELVQDVQRIAMGDVYRVAQGSPIREPVLEQLSHMVRNVEGRPIRPGQLRTYTVRSQPMRVDAADIEAIRANGADWIPLGRGRGIISYPPASTVRPELDRLLADTRAALADPSTDAIDIASSFSHRFEALHPFQDANGRVGRLVGDRILAERGVPPPILRDLSSDIVLSRAAYRQQYAEGVTRMRYAIDRAMTERGAVDYTDTLMRSTGRGRLAYEGPMPLTRIDGMPFAQGRDGLVYDMAGRPYLADAQGTLQPMSQMTYYLAMRRVAQAEDPAQALRDLTARTRTTFAHIAEDGELAARTHVASDVSAMAADNEYRAWVATRDNAALVDLYDLHRVSDQRLFGVAGEWQLESAARGARSFTMSRYQQIDLEMWHMQTALERAGDGAGAARMGIYRDELFDRARSHLSSLRAPEKVARDNPMGLVSEAERSMFERSLLRHDSLRAAIRADGDDRMFVWRGDVGVARYGGVWPDYLPGSPNALRIAAYRGSHSGGTASLWNDLLATSGATGGTGYLSSTSDLRLLTEAGGFAEKRGRATLDLAALAPPVRRAIEARTAEGQPVQLGELLTLTREGTKLRIDASNRALLLEVDKRNALPGLESLGGGFESEQEITLVSGVPPWRIHRSATRAEISGSTTPPP